MIVANAIHKLLKANFSDAIIKWPNDILIGNKKICGILIENTLAGQHIKSSIIGIGLNVNQIDFDKNLNATSLKKETGNNINTKDVLHNLIHLLQKEINHLEQNELELIKTYYMDHLYGTSTPFNYIDLINSETKKGVITNVEANGEIKIESDSILNTFSFKEIKQLL